MEAARIHEYNKPIILEDRPIPNIQPDEILVNVKACGMWRSDVQLVDGYFRPYADVPPPITIGHEIAGVVHKIESTVSKPAGFEEGDHVVVVPGWGDGICQHNETVAPVMIMPVTTWCWSRPTAPIAFTHFYLT